MAEDAGGAGGANFDPPVTQTFDGGAGGAGEPEDTPFWMKMITLTGSFEGLQNKLFVVLWIVLACIYVWAFIGWFLMMVGHGLVPGTGVSYSSAATADGGDYLKVSDKGERMALSGWMVFQPMWPPLFLIFGCLFKIPELLEVGILLVVITIAGLAIGAEQVDRMTYICRKDSGASDSTSDDCKNGRNLYLSGVVFLETAYILWFALGIIAQRLVNMLKLSTIYDADLHYDDHAGVPPPVYQDQQYSRGHAPSARSMNFEPAAPSGERSIVGGGMQDPSAFCTRCGVMWEQGDKFCRGCAAAL